MLTGRTEVVVQRGRTGVGFQLGASGTGTERDRRLLGGGAAGCRRSPTNK